ncbi:MAG TPA: hypothetical protein VJK66_05185 [Gaiellaceae bacterium]|nr:hypothetical protein [Gaiellaceae bacterium]
MSAVDDSLARVEELLARLNASREELEQLATAEDIDADVAVETLAGLSELAKEIESELARARSIADAAP